MSLAPIVGEIGPHEFQLLAKGVSVDFSVSGGTNIYTVPANVTGVVIQSVTLRSPAYTGSQTFEIGWGSGSSNVLTSGLLALTSGQNSPLFPAGNSAITYGVGGNSLYIQGTPSTFTGTAVVDVIGYAVGTTRGIPISGEIGPSALQTLAYNVAVDFSSGNGIPLFTVPAEVNGCVVQFFVVRGSSGTLTPTTYGWGTIQGLSSFQAATTISPGATGTAIVIVASAITTAGPGTTWYINPSVATPGFTMTADVLGYYF